MSAAFDILLKVNNNPLNLSTGIFSKFSSCISPRDNTRDKVCRTPVAAADNNITTKKLYSRELLNRLEHAVWEIGEN